MTFGLLILRLVFGMTMAAHGAQKLFGWFGGGGIAGTAHSWNSSDSARGAHRPHWLGSLRLAAGFFSRRAFFHHWRPQ